MVAVSLPDDDFLSRLAADSPLSEIARCLLGSEPIPFGSTYFVKEAGAGQPVLWHQDGHPWQTTLGIAEAVTLWIALDLVDGENGGLRFIPGSHRLAAQPLLANPHGGNVFGAEIDPVLVDASRAEVLVMSPGDVSAHHSNLIHGSLPNLSQRTRRALAVRYRPARASEVSSAVAGSSA
jgi:phytanoyl-CoA hydroxylase